MPNTVHFRSLYYCHCLLIVIFKKHLFFFFNVICMYCSIRFDYTRTHILRSTLELFRIACIVLLINIYVLTYVYVAQRIGDWKNVSDFTFLGNFPHNRQFECYVITYNITIVLSRDGRVKLPTFYFFRSRSDNGREYTGFKNHVFSVCFSSVWTCFLP